MPLESRFADIDLYQGSDRARIAELTAAVEAAASDKTPRMLGEGDTVKAAVDAYNSFLAEAKDRALSVHLVPLPFLAFRSLKRAHPARDDHPEDVVLGVNEETFGRDLILACWQDDTPDRDGIVDSLCEADYYMLLGAAWALNTTQAAAPKVLSASDVMPPKSETSQ